MSSFIRKRIDEIAEVTKLAGFEFTEFIKYIPNGEIIAIRALNLKNGQLVLDDIRRIDRTVSDLLPRSRLYKNDIVISYTGTVGEAAQIEENNKFHLAPNVAKITPLNDKINPQFLFYYIRSYEFKQQMLNYAHGSTQMTVPMKVIRELSVPIPPRIEQERIVSILEPIYKKIKDNEQINNNLEQQADAIYQSFFSPKSGIQGKRVTLDEYCSIFTGKKNANASVDGGKYKFFTCAPDALQIDSYIYDGNAIIISGNGAYTGRTRFYSGRFDLYQRTYACTLLDGINPDYIFPLYWFVKLELSKKIMGGTRGSAIPYIVMNDLAKFEFIYSDEMFDTYVPIFKSLTESIHVNELENEHLSNLRDTLLPQLMSGELDVSDINL